MVPIRQCLVCRTIHQQNLIGVSDNFDRCATCVRSWERNQMDPDWSYSREPTKTLIYPTLDLGDIVESYDIPGGTFKMVFLWARFSTPGSDPPVGSNSHDF
jgi:hypothetical protein